MADVQIEVTSQQRSRALRQISVVAVAVAVPLALAGARQGEKSVAGEPPGWASTLPPLEAGRSYFIASEFSGDIRKLHADSPRSVEEEYLDERRVS